MFSVVHWDNSTVNPTLPKALIYYFSHNQTIDYLERLSYNLFIIITVRVQWDLLWRFSSGGTHAKSGGQ
jgi:hypothetical protein